MSLNTHKIVILDNRYDHYRQETEVLSGIGAELIIAYPETAAEAAELLGDADGIICNLYRMDSNIINGLHKCRVISRYGVGYDNVDIKAAAAKGIAVCNVPDYAMEDASDHALAMLFNCTRKIGYRDRMIREGRWNLHRDQPCFRMTGRVLGVVGFGHIGRTLIRKISGFGFARILVDDPGSDEQQVRAAGAEKVDFEELLRSSDYVTVHCPLKPETVDMFDQQAFSMMKDGAILINTARGPIVNEQALCNALQSGKLAAAGIDVYNEEPPAKNSLLRTLENITLSDHAAWYSEESIVELKTKAALNIVEVLTGKKPSYRVN